MIVDWFKTQYQRIYGARRISEEDPRYFEHMRENYAHRSAWARLRMAQIVRMVDPRAGDRILDLGCGPGYISELLARRGAEVTGVDRSAAALSMARARCADLPCRFVQSDVIVLQEIPSNTFDKAVAADLVEHIDDRAFRSMLAASRRVCRPGSSLSILTPNAGHFIERMKSHDFILRQFPGHIAVRTPSQLEALLEEMEYRIELSYTTASPFPILRRLEALLGSVPSIGPFFQYRICIRARLATEPA
ncbi:MAG: class I SAM-dependent methyltransferase [Deltaproteobacteria bacterium]|nr:class I SAM-dependent methyltransferase [Deltaproteobacteria bacterium]